MKASFLIVNWNTRELCAQAVQSIMTHEKGGDYEIIVVDNGSTDGSAQYLKELFSNITVIATGKNLGFARGNNRGAEVAQGEWLLLLNSDAYLTEPIIAKMFAATESLPGENILTCKLLYPDGRAQVGTGNYPSLAGYLRELFLDTASAHAEILSGLDSRPGKPIPVDWVSGSFLAVRRKTYLSLGGLESSIFMYAEDLDFCRKAKVSGVRCYFLPTISLVHIGGGSIDHLSARALRLTDQGRLAYFRKWHGPVSALALRGIFLLRSGLRVALFTILGIITFNSKRLAKAWVHLRGMYHLVGAQ